MQRYWTRILVGALVIFALGMVCISFVRSGIHNVEALAKSDRPIGIPLALLPFRVDGDAIGTIRRLELLRTAPETVSGVRLTVVVDDSGSLARLRNCGLTMREFHVFGGRDGFSCVPSADSAGGPLERIGEVVLEPGGATLSILEPAAPAARWRASHYDTSAAQAELAALRAESLAAPTARAVTIHRDSTRAIIDIRARH